jgi:hypothetical protein
MRDGWRKQICLGDESKNDKTRWLTPGFFLAFQPGNYGLPQVLKLIFHEFTGP